MSPGEPKSKNNRPFSLTMIAWLYIVAGVIGFGYHFGDLFTQPFEYKAIAVELVRLLAIVAGWFLLRRRNWARWLAVIWMGFHVVVSSFHDAGEFAIHVLFFIVIAFVLFRHETARYFRVKPGVARAWPS